jgi:hypothetical protein
MDASSQTRKGASSQESLDDKNDICLRGLFKIPPLAPRPAGGTHTFSAAILPMPVSPPWVYPLTAILRAKFRARWSPINSS